MTGWMRYGEHGLEHVVVSEDAVARQFAERQAGRLRFCHDAGAWFVWDGAIWRQDRTGQTMKLAREIARELAAADGEAVRGAGRMSFVASVERFARADDALAMVAETWDADPMQLGTPGGTVDLATGTLRPADPRDAITRATAVAPADTADCPLWRRFLSETAGGDAELACFLHLFCGYALTGETREQVLLFGHGDGGNGKTVFLNTIAGILGDYARVAAPEVLSALSAGRAGASGELAVLRGARLVTASENEAGQPWAEARLKLLTGGDPINARFLRRDAFTFRPSFKLIIVGNHLPVLRGVDAALRRRIRIVPFTATPARPDRRLEAKLRAEWPAILRWMIDGCLAWQAEGLPRAAVERAASDAYLGGQDMVGLFLADACETGDPAATETASALYAAWVAWMKAAGEPPGTQRMLAAMLERRGLTRVRTEHARLYRGVRLR